MAKKGVTKKLSNDDSLDLDKELDGFDDFDFDAEEPPDDRNPATKVVHGVAEGVKDTLKDTDFIARTIKQTLPKDYGKAFDMANTVSGGLKDLYNTTATELKPVINDAKKTTAKIAPMFEGMMPKSVHTKITDWANSSEKKASASADDMKEAAIGSALGEIFGAQEQNENTREANRVAREQVRDVAEKKRARDEFEQLNLINMGITRLATYQDNVAVKVQRKSLELQYRTFFAISDLLEETKRGNASGESELKLISKNTGLPDYVKLNMSENFGEIMRNEFLGSIHDGLFGGRREFFTKLTKNIVKKGKDKVKDFRNSFESALSGVDAAAEGLAQAKEMGMDIDPLSIGANMAGQSLVEKAGAWLGKKGRGILEKNDTVRAGGHRIANFVNEFPQLAKQWAENGGGGENLPLIGSFISFLKEAVGESFSGGKSVKQDSIDDIQKPAIFNGRVSRSITDIIPGYLARIFRELQVIRTGDASLDMTVYDHTSGKFVDSKEHAKSIVKTFFNDNNRYGMDREIETVMKLLDPDGTKLTPEERKKLGLKILQDNIDNKVFSKERLTDEFEYGDFAKLMKDYIGEDKDHSKRGELSRAMMDVGTTSQIDYAKLQTLVNAGYGDVLKSIGLIGESGNIRERAILEAYLKGDPEVTGDYLKDQRVNAFGGNAVTQPTVRNKPRKKYNYRTVSGKAKPEPESGPDLSDWGLALVPGEEANVTSETFANLSGNRMPKQTQDANQKLLAYVDGFDHENLPAIISPTDVHHVNQKRMELMHGNAYRSPVKDVEDYIDGSYTVVPEKQKLLTGPTGRQSVADIVDAEIIDNATDAAPAEKKSTLFEAARKYLLTTASVLSSKYKKAKDYFKSTEDDDKVTGEQTSQSGSGKSGYVDRIIAAIEAQSVKTETTAILETLQGMLQVIGSGVPTFAASSEEGMDALPWYRQTIGGILGKAGRAGNRVVSGFFKRMKDVKDFAGRQIDRALGFGKKAFDFAAPEIGGFYRSIRNRVKTKIEELRDIYVEGEYKPRLKAELLKAGEYVDAQTGKVIEKFSDITGEVRDKAGNIVLSAEEARKAYVEKAKKMIPLKKWATNLSETAGKVSKFIFDKGSNILSGIPFFDLAKGAWNGASGIFKGVAGFFKGFTGKLFGEGGLIVAGSKKIVDELQQIRNILDDRLPKRKKITGDADGDGDRDGSYEDIVKDREADAKKKHDDKEEAENAANGGKGFGILGALKGLLGKDKDDEEDGESWYDKLGVDFDLPFGGSDEAKAKRARRRAAKKRLAKRKAGKLVDRAKKFGSGKLDKLRAFDNGRMGRLATNARGKLGELAAKRGIGGGIARGLGGVARAGSGVVGGAARAGMGALGTAGRIGLGLGGAVLQGGLGLAGSVAGGLLSGVGSVAGAALGGLGTLTMSALGGLAGLAASPVVLGAAALYGGYKLYKYATRDKMTEFDKLRYAQYGFNPSDNSHYHHILALEEAALKSVSFNNGAAGMDESSLQVKDVAEDFGVDLSDQSQVQKFIVWFRERFKPVFLTHLTAINSVKKGVKIDEIDTLDPANQKKFLQAARFNEGPYSVMVSPFPDMPKLTADGSVVTSVVKTLQESVDKAAAKTDKKATAAPVAKATAAAAVASAVADKPAAVKPVTAATPVAGVKQTPQSVASVAGTVGSAVISVAIPAAHASTGTGKMDASTAARMKAYGLTDMDVDKVTALRNLEAEVQKGVSFSKDGRADWKGSVDTMAGSMSGYFGVDIGIQERLEMWTKWFQQRFVPVYLTYASKVNSLTGKTNPALGMLSLKPAQELDVVKAVVAAKNSDGIPAWAVVYSPWVGYKLNTSSSSASENISAILEKMAVATVSQQVGKDGLQSEQNKTKLAANANPADAKKEMSFMDRAMSGAKDVWQGAKDTARAAGSAISKAGTAVANAAGDAYNAVADTVGGWFGGGNDIAHPGKGTGGDINKLPVPRGDGSYLAYKDMIDAASKMAGVDPRLMGIMAAIESSFRNKAAPGTSSAQGLYQFTGDTWNRVLKKYGAKYGLSPNANRLDPRANTLMAAEFIKENVAAIKSAKGGAGVTDTDVYLAHFLGAGGYKKFIKSPPNAVAAQLMPKEAAANVGIFYNKAKQPYTVGQIYQNMNSLLATRAKQFKITAVAGTALPQVAPPAAPAPAAPATGPAKAAVAPVAATKAVAPLTPVKTANSNAPAPAAPVSKAVATAASTGIAVHQAAAVQQAAQREVSAANNGFDIAPVVSVLERSHQVHEKNFKKLEEIDKSLKALVAATKKSKSADKEAAETPAAKAPVIKPERGAVELPAAPVPMNKPRYG